MERQLNHSEMKMSVQPDVERRRILVIDDNSDHVELIRVHLEPAGNFEVEGAATAAKGLEKAKGNIFDVILLDYRLPDQDGLDVLREMGKRDIKTPVIFITGYGDIKIAVEAMKHGAYDYLSKPEIFSPMLSRVLQAVLERFQLEKVTLEFEQTLTRAFFGMTEAMAAMVEVKDPYTAGHGEGVAKIAVAIVREMNLPQRDIDGIRISALLHDIGKIAIPSEILTKPTGLTDLERATINQHSRYGYEILKKIDFPWPVAETVLQHHERLDGSGYPQGLKGDEIILPARILAVADVADAMSYQRPYRPAKGIEAATEEIEKGGGTLYDPTVVDVWLRSIRTKKRHGKK